MFPKIDIDTTIKGESEILKLGKAYLFDYKTGQHIMVDGRLIELSEVDNIKSWIEKVLRTQLGKYQIYIEDETNDFGISVYKYLGTRVLPQVYLASELRREIREQLLQHRYIEDVTEYTTNRLKRGLEITFKVRLTNNREIDIEEVRIYGLQ